MHYHFEMENVPLKSGKPGKRWQYFAYPICHVARCERCGRFGQTGWVKRWHMRPTYEMDIRGRDRVMNDIEPTLCMACLNRLRRLWKAEAMVGEIFRLIEKIKREAQRVNAENRWRA